MRRGLSGPLVAAMVLGVCLLASAGERAGAASAPLAGWFGVFPDLTGYQRSFLAPHVASIPAGPYRQTAEYLWTGDADRRWEVTLARDPAMVQRYGTASPVAHTAPARVVLAGYRGWLWDLSQVGPPQPRWRVAVLLGPDRLLLLEGRGAGPWEDPRTLLARFNLARVAASLAAPPRTDFRRALPAFRSLRKGVPFSDVVAWVGYPDADIGSGIHVLEYRLDDGSRVLLGFPDYAHLLYARHLRPDGSVEVLA